MPTNHPENPKAAPMLHGPKSAVTLHTVTEEEAGQRIDNFLMRHFKSVPRSRVYRLLRKGEVRVNRKRVDAEYRLSNADEVRLPPVRIEASDTPGRPSASLTELLERAIIFQDRHLLVVDKPSGVAVHGGSGMSFGVIEALRSSRPRETLELVHRLDRDTSGCLLVARDRATLTVLHALIREGGRQGLRQRVQARTVLRETGHPHGGSDSDRPHPPDPSSCRIRRPPAARR